jgi:hypothetical protein
VSLRVVSSDWYSQKSCTYRGATQATCVYGNYVEEILTMTRSGSTYYYHQNQLWSVEAITDSSGNPVERYDYCGGGTLQCGDPHGAVSITASWRSRSLFWASN